MPENQFMRFFYFCSFNGLCAITWTALILIPELNMPRIVAGGSVGTWLFIGYVMFVLVGCPGILGCGVLHYLIPKIKGKTPINTLTWLHLILTEIGLIGSTWLLGLSGYIGGSLLLEGKPLAEIHESIIGYAIPIEISIMIVLLGVLIAIINLYLTIARKATGTTS
ncbi:MAG: hypothetical protein H3Z50_02180 [archaeon]|nr:hypothetical protein [archaeon]MCP8306957.1 hypothetical protein [archaeon]